jgi:hypothetical protein
MMVLAGKRVKGHGVRGQSTVEYLLVAVAVLIAILFGVKSVIQPKTKERMNQAGKVIDRAGTELQTATGIQ